MNIVFGLFNGYTTLKTWKGGIYYFIKSLRKYNNDCKIVIVCEKQHVFEDLKNFSNEMNFEIYTDFETKYSLQQYRYEIYNKYLNEIKDKVDKIFLSDVDDAIFQEDPFSINFTEEIYCALECNMLSDVNNKSSLINMNWINQYTNCLKKYENFVNQYVACSGTILGTYNGIKKFLNFYETMQKINPIDILGIDQGIYIIYVYNYLDSKHIIEYKESKILTLDSVSFDTLNRDNNNNIVNKHGEKYSVLHQTNRCNLPFMLSLVE